MNRFLYAATACAFICGALSAPSAGEDWEVVLYKADLVQGADQAERWIRRQGLDVGDTTLTGYLRSVALRVGFDTSFVSRMNIVVARSITPNAFAFPNGLLIMYTGVFNAIDNEDQLALLLAHELAHISFNHHIRGRYRFHERSAELIRAGIIGSFFVGGFATSGLNSSLQHAMSGFSRDLEAEADKVAFNHVVRAGYNLETAIGLFANLKECGGDDTLQTDTLLFTHYRFSDRTAQAREYMRTYYHTAGKPAVPDTAFRNRFRSVYAMNAREGGIESSWKPAFRSIGLYMDRMAPTAEMLAAKGGLYLLRKQEKDLDSAQYFLRKAAALDTLLPSARRDLGYCHLLKGEKDSARAYLGEYQILAPTAPDSAFIRFYLRYIDEQKK